MKGKSDGQSKTNLAASGREQSFDIAFGRELRPTFRRFVVAVSMRAVRDAAGRRRCSFSSAVSSFVGIQVLLFEALRRVLSGSNGLYVIGGCVMVMKRTGKQML